MCVWDGRWGGVAAHTKNHEQSKVYFFFFCHLQAWRWLSSCSLSVTILSSATIFFNYLSFEISNCMPATVTACLPHSAVPLHKTPYLLSSLFYPIILMQELTRNFTSSSSQLWMFALSSVFPPSSNLYSLKKSISRQLGNQRDFAFFLELFFFLSSWSNILSVPVVTLGHLQKQKKGRGKK